MQECIRVDEVGVVQVDFGQMVESRCSNAKIVQV